MTAEIKEGLFLFQKGKNDDALSALKVGYEKRVAEFGADHFSTSEVQHLIAKVLEQQCKYEEALYHSREAYRKNAYAFGTHSLASLPILRTIASILGKQEQYGEALNTYQEVFRQLIQYFGVHHEDTLSVWNNLTTVRAKLGEDVLPVYEEIYNLLKDGNPEKPLTLIVRYNIAVHLSKTSRYDEALKILKEVNDIYKRKVSTNLYTLDSLDLTADVLNKQGKHGDALEIWGEVLEMKVKMFSTSHPTTLETLQTQNEIITSFTNQIPFKEKLEILEKVYNRRMRVLGRTHSETLNAQTKIVDMLYYLGEYDEALTIYNDIYQLRKLYCPNSPDTLTALKNVAFLLTQQGKYDKALSIYKDIAKSLKNLNPDHPQVMGTQIPIANILVYQNKYDEALRFYFAAVKILEQARHFGLQHPHTLVTWCNIATIMKKQGKLDEALRIYSDVLDVVKDEGACDLMIEVQYNIAHAYYLQGKLTESQNTYELIYSNQLIYINNDHPAMLAVENNIAVVLACQRKYTKSLEILEEVYGKQISILGKNNPHTLACEMNIKDIKREISGDIAAISSARTFLVPYRNFSFNTYGLL